MTIFEWSQEWSFYTGLTVDSFGWFWMGSLRKNIQFTVEFPKAPLLILHFSYYTLMTFLMMLSVILWSMPMILLYSKRDQASDLWKQLELASELESDRWDTVDLGKKWLVDFNAGETQLVSFDWSNNTGAIDVKMDASVLVEKWSFKMLGLAFSLSFFLKLPPRELESWFVLWNFFLLRLLCISINLQHGHA